MNINKVSITNDINDNPFLIDSDTYDNNDNPFLIDSDTDDIDESNKIENNKLKSTKELETLKSAKETHDNEIKIINNLPSIAADEKKIVNRTSNQLKSININDLSTEQKIAYKKVVQGQNVFITGPGGTGKTKLISVIIDFLKSISKTHTVCAMTGCAAILLNSNAKTLHSWSGIKLAKGSINEVINMVLRNKRLVQNWKRTKCIILDEVSMLSKKIFEIIEELARIIHGSSKPFGGMQVIFTGDFFQLPPVGTEGEPDTDKFCFESPRWNLVFTRESQIELKTIFRQNDPIYTNILTQIRQGELDEENTNILKKYVKRQFDEKNHNGCIPTKIFPLRTKVDYLNTMMFLKLQEKEYIFDHIKLANCISILESGKPLDIDILKKCSMLSSQMIEYEITQLINNTPCLPILRLKKGAAVMCTVNLDMENGICNGSQGVVIDIIESVSCNIPIVQFSNGIKKKISPHYWQSEEYPTIAIGQIPLCLAWALTIHKIQGATLEMAEMDIGQSIFEYGQTYVALSRIKSLDGLYLSEFHPYKIKANPLVKQYYKNLSDIQQITMDTEIEIKPEEYIETPNNVKIIKL
jgi:ATP-dependent DNA helicase PIF1